MSTPTKSYSEYLYEARVATAKALAELPIVPDYDINGQRVWHGSLREQLARMLKDLDGLIASAEGPFEIEHDPRL